MSTTITWTAWPVAIALTLITVCLKTIDGQNLFTETVDGSVEAGNYTYYTYAGVDKLVLTLSVHSGDADLYVSQADGAGRAAKPRFDYHEHDLSSATCGLDVVQVPAEDQGFKRPVGIAVYGHPSREISRYTLEVAGVEYFDANDRFEHQLDAMTADELNFYEEFFGETYSGFAGRRTSDRQRRLSEKSTTDGDHRKGSGDGEGGRGSETWDFFINLLANILHILLEAVL